MWFCNPRQIVAAIVALSLPVLFAGWPPAFGCEDLLNREETEGYAPDKFIHATGVFGLTSKMQDHLLTLLQQHFGDALIDAYVIGSRSAGHKGSFRGKAPVGPTSDMDTVLHLKNGFGSKFVEAAEAVQRDLKAAGLIPFRIEIHTTATEGNRPFKGTVQSYHGGIDASFQIIRRSMEPAARPEIGAVRITE